MCGVPEDNDIVFCRPYVYQHFTRKQVVVAKPRPIFSPFSFIDLRAVLVALTFPVATSTVS